MNKYEVFYAARPGKIKIIDVDTGKEGTPVFNGAAIEVLIAGDESRFEVPTLGTLLDTDTGEVYTFDVVWDA